VSSANNLKQIALAMHNYHTVHNKFPARASLGDDGKPLLSWRVHILPFLEQEGLYQQFRLDEPWDSPHNRQSISQMPQVYRNPSSRAPEGATDYLAPVGPGTIFESSKGAQMRNITDGASKTALVLEVNSDAAVEWTKPADFGVNPDNPLAGLGNAHRGGFNAALADGSVRFISKAIDPQVFLNLMKMDDGQAVRLP
jgi:prepilin-type processing-associated H-X9-DG protein